MREGLASAVLPGAPVPEVTVKHRLGVDDSDSYALDDATVWWAGNSSDDVDLYFFGHGRDYKAALRDLAFLTGPTALAPRYALGVWWTRWFDLTQADCLDAVDAFEEFAQFEWHRYAGRGTFPKPFCSWRGGIARPLGPGMNQGALEVRD